jgi:calpain-5
MTFEDFCKHFHQTAICRVVNTSFFSINKTWHEGLSHGAWRKPDRAGGCPNNRETFLKNPQVFLLQSSLSGEAVLKIY